MGANGRKRRHRRRRSSWRSTVVLMIAAVVVLAAGYVLMERWESSRYQETRGVVSADFYEKKEISVNGKSYVLKSDLESVLVMGVDHPDETQEKAEMWMLLVMDHENKQLHWMHIGRDTVLNDEKGLIDLSSGQPMDSDSETRNAARVASVEALLGGVDVEHYITLELDRVGELNRLLGGVPVTLEEDFSAYDPAMTPGKKLVLTDDQAVLFLDDAAMFGTDPEAALMKRQQAYVLGMLEALKAKVSADSDAIDELMNRLGAVLDTNYFTAQMLNEFARAYSYQVPEVRLLPGKYILDESGRRVYQPDLESVRTWTLETFYSEGESSLGNNPA